MAPTPLQLILLMACVVMGGEYGCSYGGCALEPAPAGRAPPCAKGLTYCVDLDPYPEQIIQRLVEEGQYDIGTLLSDESRDAFPPPRAPYAFGPNSLAGVDHISIVNDEHSENYNSKFTVYKNEILSQKTPIQPPPPIDPPYNFKQYQAMNFSNFGYQDQRSRNYWGATRHRYNGNPVKNIRIYNQKFYNTNYDTDWYTELAVTRYDPNEWWKRGSPGTARIARVARAPRRRRNAELVRAAAKRPLSGAEALRIALGLTSVDVDNAPAGERSRRQTGAEELCRARTQFVTPRAALNTRGAWRYVVNMRANMTQLVRAEVCMSTECSGLCAVPFGYSSRCEQRYIQKRLVALETTGQNLYTDVFWIPSCCQCTIVLNN